MDIKAAIFDFDGTLFDSMYVWDNVTEKYLNSIGVSSPNIDESRLKSMSLLVACEFVKEEFDLFQSVEQIMDGFNQVVRKEYEFNVQPKDGVVEFLEILKKNNIALTIASVSEYEHIKAALKRCKIDNYFSEIFSCSATKHGKRRPDVYNNAFSHLKKLNPEINKKNTFVFEDALYALEVVKNDGFTTIAVRDDSEKCPQRMKDLSYFYIDDFRNLDNFYKLIGVDK